MKTPQTFDALGLSAKTLAAIQKKGFVSPTAIQALTIPLMLSNTANIIAQAQTGTGKTAAFGLPLIELIDTGKRQVQALILVPTRELAMQVSDEITSLNESLDLKVAPIYGGQAIDQQLYKLKRGVHIVVGTPGRVIDHLKRKTLDLGKIEHLIFDEADEMLNMGFIEDMEEIMKYTNPDKKTLLFSATMPDKIKELAHKYMDGYEFLSAKEENTEVPLTEQIYFIVKASEKFEALCRIIDIEDDFYGLIFCRTKIDTDSISSHLMERGYATEAIHGDISQGQRERTLDKFRKRKIHILVATDVAARGIDVNNLTHVVNYSLPQDPESYIHRIGRTGRAGKKGTAISFISAGEQRRMMFIQRIAKTEITQCSIPSVKDIIEIKQQKISAELGELLKTRIDSVYIDWAETFLEQHKPKEIIAAMLHHFYAESLNPKNYGDISSPSAPKDRRPEHRSEHRSARRSEHRSERKPERRPDRRPDASANQAKLLVALGKKDKINPRLIIQMLTGRVKIDLKDINDIRIMDKYSYVSVPYDKVDEIVACFKQDGQKPVFTHLKKKNYA